MALSNVAAFAMAPIEAVQPVAKPVALLRGGYAATAAPTISQVAATSSEDGSSSSMAAGLAVAGALGAVATFGREGRRTTRTARRFFGAVSQQPVVDNRPVAIPALPAPGYRQRISDKWAREIDAGFDPLNLATSPSPFGGKVDPQETYFNYREAEVKHGRLAMLATLGWLSSEEFGPTIARQMGMQDLLANRELAPSVINGGLGNLPLWFLPAVFVVSALIDREAPKPELYGEKRIPGDMNFDPLYLANGLKLQSGIDILQLHNAEVKHGRAAMIGITVFVLQEYFWGIPVLKEDEMAADFAVGLFDKGIVALDKTAGLSLPQLPLPFPGL